MERVRTFRQTFIEISILGFLVMGLILLAGTVATAQPQNITDRDITLELRRQLIANDRVAAHLIDIRTEDGVVTLSGTVDHLLAKDQAEELAQNMIGVVDVNNQLTVNPVYRSDEELRQDILNALAQDTATEAFEIEVEVEAGIVTLSGTVQSTAERKIAEQVAKGVRGIIMIQNDLAVITPVMRSDAEIQAEVERRLELDPVVDANLIDVEVADGEVTLIGTVGSLRAKSEAADAAWTTGVSAVDTGQLAVTAWSPMEEPLEPVVVQTDPAIERAVNDALLYDPDVVSTDVLVIVDNGVVTLTGSVDSYLARRSAEQTAEEIAGVIRVNNYLVVRPQTPLLTDDEIARNVRDALMRDPIVDSTDITVSVLNQKVYLRGIADTTLEKQQAEDVAGRVNGVIDVQSSITVDLDWTWKSDQEIRENVQDEYFWSPFVDGSNIQVSVSDGKATLTGVVDTWNEHQAAVDNAFEAGASSVVSYLEVEESPGIEDYARYYNQSNR